MFRFMAVVWQSVDEESGQGMQEVARKIGVRDEWHSVVDLPGLRVWYASTDAGISDPQVLPDHTGVILGPIFQTQGIHNSRPSSGAVISSRESSTVIDSAGQSLLRNQWGQFVAILRDPATTTTWVLRDPSGGMECYYTLHRGAHVYFSDVEDAASLRVFRFSFDWHHIIAQMVLPTMRAEHTAINGLRELVGGQGDEIKNGRVTTTLHWNPAQISQNLIDDFDEAISAMRAVVTSTVQTWAGLYKHILHMLSGGVDSSVVLACLADMLSRPDITCLTQYLSGPGGGDEREYARLAAQMVECEHIERPDNIGGSLAVALEIVRSARPGLYTSCVNAAANQRLARECDAQAIFHGIGGDALFYESREHGLSDYLFHHPFGWRAPKIARDSARLQGVSVWSAIQAARRTRHAPVHPNYMVKNLKQSHMLTPHAVEVAQRHRDESLHPWLRHTERIPPGAELQIAMMAQPMSGRSPIARPGDAPYVSVLASGDLFATCLRIPTYWNTKNRRTRRVVREAFKHRLPHAIVDRTDKGFVGGGTEKLLWNNRDFINDHLPHGILVKEGWVDQKQVIEAISDRPTRNHPTRVFQLLSAELWLRAWGRDDRHAAVA